MNILSPLGSLRSTKFEDLEFGFLPHLAVIFEVVPVIIKNSVDATRKGSRAC
jgi:hypothetical protein